MAVLSYYDLKQVVFTRYALQKFENKEIGLVEFSRYLGGIIDAFEAEEIFWKDDLRRVANCLEMVCADIASNDVELWREDPKEYIEGCIVDLKKVLNFLEKKFLEESKASLVSAKILEGAWFMCPKCTYVWREGSRDNILLCPSCEEVLVNS